MSGPTTSVLDDFNRSNTGPPPSTNWTTLFSGHKVVSNACVGNGSVDNISYWNVSTFGADCEAYRTISTKPPNGNYIQLHLRFKDMTLGTTDGYVLSCIPQAGTDIWRIYRLDNSVLTQLGADITSELTAGDKMLFTAIGSTLEVWQYTSGAWVSLGSRTDATYGAAGYIGIGDYTTGCVSDDFGGGTYVPPPIPVFMNQYRQRSN